VKEGDHLAKNAGTFMLILLMLSTLILGEAKAEPAVSFEFDVKFGKGIERKSSATNYPSGVAVDPLQGGYFVMDLLNNRVKRYDAQGEFINYWLCQQGLGLTVDARNGLVWVAMWKNHTVNAYSPTGSLLLSLGTKNKAGTEPGQFSSPHDVSIDPSSGELYVMDTGNKRVQVFDTSLPLPEMARLGDDPSTAEIDWEKFWLAVFIETFEGDLTQIPGASPFSADLPETMAEIQEIRSLLEPSSYTPVAEFDREFKLGGADHRTQFVKAFGISVHPEGEFLIVTNTGHREVVKLTTEGEVIARWKRPTDQAIQNGPEGVPVGSKPGEFRWPRGVAVDRDGFIYVADTDNERVQKLDSDGDFVSFMMGPNDRESGAFHPRALDVHPDTGEVVAAAAYANRLDRFDAEGDYTSSFGQRDTTSFHFNQMKGISVDTERGIVYVSDWMDHAIRRFDLKSGQFLDSFDAWIEEQHLLDGTSLPPDFYTDPESVMWPVKEDQAFPGAMDVDSSGNVWMIRGSMHYDDDPRQEADWLVRSFDSSGDFVTGFGHKYFPRNARMRGIVVDQTTDEVYVANSIRHSVMKFAKDGTLLWEVGTQGSGSKQFEFPTGMAIAPDAGRLYVVDSHNHRIQVLDLNGDFVDSFGEKGSELGQFNFGDFNGLSLDARGYLYVGDSNNDRIQVLGSGGDPVTEFGQKGFGGLMHYRGIPDVEVADGKLYVLDSAGGQVEVYRIRYADSAGN
jgi:DNA-binding beta-propeller fold protein YncE